ncbi:MAG: type IV pilus assembly protein PilM [Verrucomicrobia bacterium]|nr:type IV pilus assembly protein PilM [Verrucomicrobiota bacterium]
MLNAKSFLCLDLGAGGIKAAEFEVNEAGALLLKQFGTKSLAGLTTNEPARETAIIAAIKELVAERGMGSKAANVCTSGSNVFSKFVKLPPVDSSKVAQIIEYEAKQNVPFPLEEVVWDFQILGTAASGELEVLLVAIKRDVVEGLFRTAESAGLNLQLLDVSPAALCNAFRYNYGDAEGCSMMLDIGAKTSNVLFFEKGKVFSRSINIGANAITQDFVNESKLSFAEADAVKIEKGFVSLGGAYEEPEDPHAAAISKIARQVMTRLHIQVNQTIQFYRGQQGGSAPARVFLAGGASILPYTAQFFADKLNLPVEYFNPFRNVQVNPGLQIADLEKVAHCFGEIVGLALRNLAHCPVELNLMPKSSIQKQQFSAKRPYFAAMVLCLVLVVFAYGYFYDRLVDVKKIELDRFKAEIAPLKANDATLRKSQSALKKGKEQGDQYVTWIEDRTYWTELLAELRRACIQTELLTANALRSRQPNAEAGVWIESMAVQTTDLPPAPAGTNQPSAQPDPNAPPPAPAEGAEGGAAAGRSRIAGGPAGPVTNQIMFIKLSLRGVNQVKISPSANSDMAFKLEAELKNSPMFDPDRTSLSAQLETVDENALTFGFGVTLTLKRPIRY